MIAAQNSFDDRFHMGVTKRQEMRPSLPVLTILPVKRRYMMAARINARVLCKFRKTFV
jgi:hypothetical protein